MMMITMGLPIWELWLSVGIQYLLIIYFYKYIFLSLNISFSLNSKESFQVSLNRSREVFPSAKPHYCRVLCYRVELWGLSPIKDSVSFWQIPPALGAGSNLVMPDLHLGRGRTGGEEREGANYIFCMHTGKVRKNIGCLADLVKARGCSTNTSVIHWLIQWWFVKISLWPLQALMVEDGALSIDYVTIF